MITTSRIGTPREREGGGERERKGEREREGRRGRERGEERERERERGRGRERERSHDLMKVLNLHSTHLHNQQQKIWSH